MIKASVTCEDQTTTTRHYHGASRVLTAEAYLVAALARSVFGQMR